MFSLLCKGTIPHAVSSRMGGPCLAFEPGSRFHHRHAQSYATATSPPPRPAGAGADARPASHGLPVVLDVLRADRMRSFRAGCFRAVYYTLGRGDDEQPSAAVRTMHALRRHGCGSDHAERRAGNGALSVSGAEDARLAEQNFVGLGGFIVRANKFTVSELAVLAKRRDRALAGPAAT
jgi:hypothetical protein